MRLLLFMFALAGTGLDAATLTARLRPATVNLGNSTTLTLVCDASANTVDPVSTPEYLGLSFVTLKRDTVILNGDRRNETQFVYKITPKRVGRYAVPAFKTRINDQEIRSEPVTLTVLTADGSNNNSDPAADQQQPAILRVTTPAREVYVGEVFPLTLELLAERLRQNHLPVPQVKTKSIVLTRIRPQFQQSVNRTLGGKLYFAFNFQTGAMVMSPGKINLEFEVEVTVEDFTRNVFGEKRTLKLTSHPIPITVKPLPTAGRPDTFTGAVGEFSMSTSAQPQEIKTGDPVELTVRLTGKGSLASTPIPGPPPPNNWDGFKIHDATDSVRHTDLRNLHVVKDFKQMVIPLRPEIRAVPPLAFSYFDPEREQYVTLHSEPVLLRVNGPSVEPQGGDPALIEPDLPENPSPVKLKTNRSHPGQLAIVPQPLLTQSWFIALPAMTLFAFLAAFAYRRREMYLDAHPEIRRRIHVRRITAQTLKRLQDPATQKDADEFMSGLQLILRENLGESLGQPAEGLTAEAIQQSDLNLSPQSREALDRIFDQDEMIRFAHADDPLNPHSLLQDLRTVLAELKS